MSTISAMEELEDRVLAPGQGEMSVLDQTGDTKITWDRSKPAEVEAARATFNSLKAKGYTAYSVKPQGESAGQVVREFDPDIQRLILVPPVVGG